MAAEKKKLGLWTSTSLAVGNMTGSGIFLLPASLAMFGGISIFGWIFTMIGSLFLALVFSRLSRMFTKSGGPYAYTVEGFGNFAGFFVAWGYWISTWSGNAAIAVAGVGYLSFFMPSLEEHRYLSALVAVGAIWLFTYINSLGVRKVGLVQLLTTLLKVVPLILFGTIGFLHFDRDHFSPLNLSGEPAFDAIAATAALTLWAFLGLESATIPSEQVKEPSKTIPRATLLGISITALLFISSTVGIMGIMSPAQLQDSAAPFADAARMVWGGKASSLIAAGAAIACFGALNGWILIQGQIPMAASRDRLFPPIFKKENSRGVPLPGILIASVLATILVGFNYSRGLVAMFSFIIKLATLSCLLPYLFSSLVELSLYLRKKKTYTRKGLARILAVSIPAFLYSLWAITGLDAEILLWGLVLLAAGLPVYLLLRKRE